VKVAKSQFPRVKRFLLKISFIFKDISDFWGDFIHFHDKFVDDFIKVILTKCGRVYEMRIFVVAESGDFTTPELPIKG